MSLFYASWIHTSSLSSNWSSFTLQQCFWAVFASNLVRTTYYHMSRDGQVGRVYLAPPPEHPTIWVLLRLGSRLSEKNKKKIKKPHNFTHVRQHWNQWRPAMVWQNSEVYVNIFVAKTFQQNTKKTQRQTCTDIRRTVECGDWYNSWWERTYTSRGHNNFKTKTQNEHDLCQVYHNREKLTGLVWS